MLIGSDNILPPLSEDVTIQVSENSLPDDVSFRHIGLKSYPRQELSMAKDFNLTGEIYGEDGCGLIIDSEKVKEVCRVNKFKGIAFKPILDRSSLLYGEYLERFKALNESIMLNPLNVIS